jgi:hypothetical protein
MSVKRPKAAFVPIERALALGWRARQEYSPSFEFLYFDGPVEFEIHWEHDGAVFRVGEGVTPNIGQAIQLLEKAAGVGGLLK